MARPKPSIHCSDPSPTTTPLGIGLVTGARLCVSTSSILSGTRTTDPSRSGSKVKEA